ncbi:MAG TPA: hypothetical protein VLA56_03715 [Pseudomonadales bacterium]|nr:hypothetical protein [Pseudomonadales bacterium]
MDQVRWIFGTDADAARELQTRRRAILVAWLLMGLGVLVMLPW